MLTLLVLFVSHVIPYWTCVWLYDPCTGPHFGIAARSSVRNQLLVTLPCMKALLAVYPVQWNGVLPSIAAIPIMAVIADMFFFLVHRPLHSAMLWHLHRSHHAGDISVVRALDADMFEHLIANIGMASVGVLLLYGAGFVLNFAVLCCWVSGATVCTCMAHSNLRMAGDNGVHLKHHLALNCNYGFGLCLLDRVFSCYHENSEGERLKRMN